MRTRCRLAGVSIFFPVFSALETASVRYESDIEALTEIARMRSKP
jgi:hypothetical protein